MTNGGNFAAYGGNKVRRENGRTDQGDTCEPSPVLRIFPSTILDLDPIMGKLHYLGSPL